MKFNHFILGLSLLFAAPAVAQEPPPSETNTATQTATQTATTPAPTNGTPAAGGTPVTPATEGTPAKEAPATEGTPTGEAPATPATAPAPAASGGVASTPREGAANSSATTFLRLFRICDVILTSFSDTEPHGVPVAVD